MIGRISRFFDPSFLPPFFPKKISMMHGNTGITITPEHCTAHYQHQTMPGYDNKLVQSSCHTLSSSVARFSSRKSGGVAYPLGSVFSRISASVVDISVVNIHSKLHGTVGLCFLSLFILRSHFLFQAMSCIGYMHASVYLLFSCSHSRDAAFLTNPVAWSKQVVL